MICVTISQPRTEERIYEHQFLNPRKGGDEASPIIVQPGESKQYTCTYELYSFFARSVTIIISEVVHISSRHWKLK